MDIRNAVLPRWRDRVNEWSGKTERIFTCSRVYFLQGAERLKGVRGETTSINFS
jgi:hypothetical protein